MIVKQWRELDAESKNGIVEAYKKTIDKLPGKKVNAGKLHRVFDLGNPTIILDKDNDGAFCRIHADSKPVMELLLKNYIFSEK